MKNIIFISTYIILVSFFFSGVSFADSDTDCPLVELYYDSEGNVRKGTDNSWNVLLENGNTELKSILDTAYPRENVIQAIYNLRWYCCQTQYLKIDQWICTKNINIKNWKWAESRFLYDHIIDVWFRHLDGVTDENYVYENMAEPDEKAKEWREKINKLAVDAEWAIPGQIVQEFEKAWYNPNSSTANQSPVNIVTIDRTQAITKGLKKISGSTWDEMWLASKYYATCYIGLFLNPSITQNWSKLSSYLSCRNIANDRISKEAGFVKVISIEQWAQLLSTNLSIYTSKYFVQEWLMRVLDKVWRLGSSFNYLQQKAQGTAQCSMG